MLITEARRHTFTTAAALSSAGWWLVENEGKHLAWFPAPYLELLDGEDEDESGSLGGGLFACGPSKTRIVYQTYKLHKTLTWAL